MMKKKMKKGIDVSYANGSIDWVSAKKDVDFAIVRSSFGDDLPSQIDSFFYQNANGCVKNNIPFGTYHFAYFTSVEKAKGEADFAIRLANEYKDKIKFIALDIEEDSERYAQRVGANPDWTACALTFMNRIQSAGYTPVLYSNQSWLQNQLDYSRLKDFKLWYAAPGAAQPKYSCALWQYTWEAQISGIRGDVDGNFCYDDSLFTGTKSTSAGASTGNNSNKNATQSISHISSSMKVDYDVVVTANDGVNIRAGASTAFQIIGAIPKGVKLHISNQTADKTYTWGLTTYGGTVGWIALNFTKKIQKTTDEIAREAIRGQWGAGDERVRRLTAAGYDYNTIQNRVNEMLSGKNKKTVDELAREVIAGKWSAGNERERLLKQAGYDYQAVQKRVNELMKK